MIDSAMTSLNIAIFKLTQPDIAGAIISAKKRGVAVRVITDRSEYEDRTNVKQVNRLFNAAIPIKMNTHQGKMHLKVTIADQAVVATGSFNYTIAAASRNDEVLVIVRDPAVAKEWNDEFNRLWTDGANFLDFKPTR
ncbi:MAG: phospholipase D family protein [Deltaproteobacteria bacterium]|nr:phospholipase D family protein [Deltaproteobacteria bacterium]